jgi:hypothetical protein
MWIPAIIQLVAIFIPLSDTIQESLWKIKPTKYDPSFPTGDALTISMFISNQEVPIRYTWQTGNIIATRRNIPSNRVPHRDTPFIMIPSDL